MTETLNRGTRYRTQDRAGRRALLGAVGMTVAVGVLARLAGVADVVAMAVLSVAALGWLGLVGLGRELRIRRRLADVPTGAVPDQLADLPWPAFRWSLDALADITPSHSEGPS